MQEAIWRFLLCWTAFTTTSPSPAVVVAVGPISSELMIVVPAGYCAEVCTQPLGWYTSISHSTVEVIVTSNGLPKAEGLGATEQIARAGSA